MPTEQKNSGKGALQIGTIHGDAKIIQHSGVYTSVTLQSDRRPESQLQSEFAQRTGIWCPKPAREWLEHLMEHHRFTARELVVCWKAGSIGWDADRDTKRIVTLWVEAVFAYGSVGLFSLYLLAVALHILASDKLDKNWGWAFLCGFGAIYLGMCWLINRTMIWPRRVALRIRRQVIAES